MTYTPLWDVAWDHADWASEFRDKQDTWLGGFATGAEWGAGWVFAIIGMAEAIRLREYERWTDGSFQELADTSTNEPCSACDAEAGELCRPGCVANLAVPSPSKDSNER